MNLHFFQKDFNKLMYNKPKHKERKYFLRVLLTKLMCGLMLMVRKYSLLRRASGNRRNRLLGYCLRECSSGVKFLTKNEMTDVFTF